MLRSAPNPESGRIYDVPAEFYVKVRPIKWEDFEGVVTSLEDVFRGSVETGNPVHWHS